MIPGARGCTPSRAFADLALSPRSSANQAEAADRLHPPFSLLSDDADVRGGARPADDGGAGSRLLMRLTLDIADGRIEKVFSSVFPS